VSILGSLLAVLQGHALRPKSTRKSQRLAVSTPARLRTSAPNAVWEQVTLDNLSLGGARMVSTTRLSAASKVDLLVNLDGMHEIELRARVVYARAEENRQTACGLRFLDLSYERYQALIAYLTEHEQKMTIGFQHPRENRPA